MTRIKTAWPLMVAAIAMTAVPVAAQQVCQDYTKKSERIGRLGGRNAVSKTPVDSVGDLRAYFEKNRSEFDDILAKRGLERLAEDLYGVMRSDLSTVSLEPGTELEWMTWRKGNRSLTATGPVCMATWKPYEAWIVDVDETVGSTPGKPMCELSAPENACNNVDVTIDASGSSSGVSLTSTGGGGNLLSGGGTSWTGRLDPGTYEFVAEASARGTRSVVTHAFVVPKICANLAYSGASEPKEMPGDETSCRETRTVVIDDCTTPECQLTVSASEIGAGGVVTVDADGIGDFSVDVVNKKGKVLQTITSFPADVQLKRSGMYTFRGKATYGDKTAECDNAPVVDVTSSGAWIARFFGGPITTDGEMVTTSTFRPNGVNERSAISAEDGTLFGASLERLFTDRVGLEFALMTGSFDASLKYDLDGDWEMGDENFDILAFTVGPNFHLTPDSRVDFYVGPFLGYADLDGATFNLLGDSIRRDVDGDFLFGAQAGLDIPFGDSAWGLNFAARYMKLDADLSGTNVPSGADMAIDPFLVSGGLRVRF